MELMNFFKSLKRHRTILILVPVLISIIAYFVSKHMPDKYVSHARLASSVADKSQQLINEGPTEESKVNLEFDNLLQTLTLNKVMDRVSYKLMLHDLDSATPFRKLTPVVTELTPAQREKARQVFTTYCADRRSLNLSDLEEKKLYKMLKSMHYDYTSLRKEIVASRMDNSQYINLEYDSDNPQLSAFVLNTLADEFLNYYTTVSNDNKNKSLQFLDSLLQSKQQALMANEEMLKKYKIENGILNIDDEAKSIYNQIAELQTKKGTAQKDVVASNVALRNIDNKFKPENHKYFESSVSGLNTDIVALKDQFKQANEAYVKSGFDSKYKAEMDSLQARLTSRIYAQTDNAATNPLAAKDNLITQKMTLEVSRDLAQNSVQTLDAELNRLNQHLQKLVPNLASIQALQAKMEVANKEYQDVLQKYNQANLEANAAAPVRIVERAVPGEAVPNMKIMMVALSGVGSLILCIFVFFVIFYFDNSIRTSDQLQDILNVPVLGSLNQVRNDFVNLHDLWSQKELDKGSQVFKNALRSIRLEIENQLEEGKGEDNNIIAVTSLNEGEGKTFFTQSLAYAFARVNKKVLIIDGNFMNPEISNTINGPNYIEAFLSNKGQTKMVDNEFITVIGNKGGDGSLLELNNAKNIRDFFSIIKSIYDVIIIETSAMDGVNKANAREWISVSDKVLVVFEACRKLDESAQKHIAYLKQLGGKLSRNDLQ
jgi:succinoglycan biosynthesis transport protein ExoP